jgi:putative serine protease PepD
VRVTGRARRAGLAAATAVVIAGGGVAVGAAAFGPPAAISTTSTTSASAPRGPAGVSGTQAPGSYADVVRQVLPSVVLIRTADGLGSGVVLDRSGNIVTNAHVAGQSTTFQVQVQGDPAPRDARLVGSYPPDDLAVIRVSDTHGLVPARFGDSAKVAPGDVVLAVGNPLGLSGSVTSGIVSAIGRVVAEPSTPGAQGNPGAPATTLPGAIQTSAPINPGNSGGALVNTSGEVIGIPTLAAASPQGGSQAQGIGFAIPANLARDIAGQIIADGHVTNSHRAALGAQVASVTRPDGTPGGAGIVTLTSGGPADRAGIRVGDVIREAGGTRTPDVPVLSQVLAAAHPGQQLALTISRGTQNLTVHVTLGELPGS